jgi:hypothetical protein
MPGVLKIRCQPVITGPIADGTATKATQEWAERTSGKLGDTAITSLRSVTMDRTGRATGAFSSNLEVTRISPTETRVKGPQIRGVTWASWLEGTSKRNTSTRFKGYHLFRKTRLEVSRRAQEIGEQVLADLMPEIGGD